MPSTQLVVASWAVIAVGLLVGIICAAAFQPFARRWLERERAGIRERATYEERVRMSRELHDGPIQSLIGAEMSLAALRQRARLDGVPEVDDSLREAQEILRQEVAGLRELMVRVRPFDLPPGGLRAYLERAVRRFSRESGIRCDFVTDDDPGAETMPRRSAIGLARIAHEALTNVRKHSAATRVVVTLRSRSHATHLLIEDNGRGFDAAQPWSTPELIEEEARSLGAELRITSESGRGVRVELVLPAGEQVALDRAAS